MIPTEAAFVSYEDALDKIIDTVDRLKKGEFPEDKDKLNALKIFRQCTVDINPAKYYCESNKRDIVVFYLIRSIVNDFFRNLGTDASFDFKPVIPNAAIFTENLGLFAKNALITNKESETLAFNHLLDSLYAFFDAIILIRNRVQNERKVDVNE